MSHEEVTLTKIDNNGCHIQDMGAMTLRQAQNWLRDNWGGQKMGITLDPKVEDFKKKR